MAHPRRFRFGIQLTNAASRSAWVDQARRAEDLGFSTLFLPDHFGDQLAPVPAMMAAADATTRLRVGALVHDNDFKHPVVLAKELATLDLLSEGRLEVGIGAGWMTTDYEQSGIPHDPAPVRVSRMEEAVTVLKGLFGPDPVTFEGEHYRLQGLSGTPRPVQQPHPPLLIGGGGRRVLSFAAREADIVGINPALRSGAIDASTAADATGAATDRKVAWVREAAGARFEDLELNCLLFAVIETDDVAGTNELMAGLFGIDPGEVGDVPHALVGSTASMCETLQARRERWGMSYVVVQADAMDAMAGVIARLADT
jgi:probable F420-dependent oxidoreductase